MADQKHFSYDGHVTLAKPTEGEVLDVVFLTPARIKYHAGGYTVLLNAQIDIANRQVYCDGYDTAILSKAVFDHLDAVNTLPENFFEASDDIYQGVQEAQLEHEKLKESGGLNG